MYIDFHKYNYDLVPIEKREEYIQRDKEAYKKVFLNWISDNLEKIVNRKWEINEIHYLKNISDFIKLIREAEQLYELGFYTSCIALIGIASEDFLKYLAIQLGKPEYEPLSQFNRLNKLKADNLLSNTTHSLLDSIRGIRNDCLHYDQNFKQKTDSDLKVDALTVLNNLKDTLKDILGEKTEVNPTDFTSIISSISSGSDAKNWDEMAAKVKNAVSHLLKFPIALDPDQKIKIKSSIFKILEIDEEFDEISLQDQINGLYVVVEYPETERKYYKNKSLREGDIVQATLVSKIDVNGLTAEWNLFDIDKVLLT